MGIKKGIFIQRKNRTEGLSKSKTQTKAEITLGFDDLVFDKTFKKKYPERFKKEFRDGKWNIKEKTLEMRHYCMYGAFGEGEYMEYQNLYSPDNPFEEI